MVSFDPHRVLELLVWGRIAHPSSKKGAWERRTAFPRGRPFSLDDVYRLLTYLDERSGEMVRHMGASLEAAQRPLDTRVLYCDVINYYCGCAANAAGKYRVKSRIGEKAVYVTGEDGRRRRIMVPVKQVAFWSREFAERSRAERAKFVEKSVRAIARGDIARLRALEFALRAAGARRPRDRRGRRDGVGARRGQDRRGRPLQRLLLHRDERAGHGGRRGDRRLSGPVEDRGVLPRSEGRDGRPARPPLHGAPDQGLLPGLLHRPARHAPQADRRRADDGLEALGRRGAGALAGVVGHRLDANHWIFDYRTNLTDAIGEAAGVDLTHRVASKVCVREETEERTRPTSENVARRRAVLPARCRRTALFQLQKSGYNTRL